MVLIFFWLLHVAISLWQKFHFFICFPKYFREQNFRIETSFVGKTAIPLAGASERGSPDPPRVLRPAASSISLFLISSFTPISLSLYFTPSVSHLSLSLPHLFQGRSAAPQQRREEALAERGGAGLWQGEVVAQGCSGTGPRWRRATVRGRARRWRGAATLSATAAAGTGRSSHRRGVAAAMMILFIYLFNL